MVVKVTQGEGEDWSGEECLENVEERLEVGRSLEQVIEWWCWITRVPNEECFFGKVNQ